MDSELLKEIAAKVNEIRLHLAQAKSDGWTPNEADTERIIVSPLLSVLGYSPLEIRQRGHDSVANNFPDYTLLPATAHRWFLEVKRLDHSLSDGDAAQAVNYANNQGAEWAVLTNGRKWYIYSAHLLKSLPEKRVFQIDDLFGELSNLEIFECLSRSSMLSGGLARAWRLSQVNMVIREQFDTANSRTRRLLLKIAIGEIDTLVTDEMIGQALSLTSSTRHAESGTAIKSRSHPTAQADFSASAQPGIYTLSEIAADSTLCTHKKPTCLFFADGTRDAVATSGLVTAIIQRVVELYGLPALPFSNRPRGKSYFLNSQPIHSTGISMKAYRTISAGNRTIYIDANRSSVELIIGAAAVCRAVRAPENFAKNEIAK